MGIKRYRRKLRHASAVAARYNMIRTKMARRKFGRLRVIGPAGTDHRGEWKWRCKCQCGNIVVVLGGNLRSGATTSCGCLHKEWTAANLRTLTRFSSLDRALRQLFSVYKSKAKAKGNDWRLTYTDCKKLFRSSCFYCGTPPASLMVTGGKRRCSAKYNGIDRMDNELGYVPGNVVPCCSTCNFAKNNLPFSTWRRWVRRLSRHFKRTAGWRR